jgi:hypothetical protein
MTTLAERIWAVFSENRPAQRTAYKRAVANTPGGMPVFSTFDQGHLRHAMDIFSRFDAIRMRSRDEPTSISDVLDAFEALKGSENPDLLYYALELFLTHSIKGLQFQLPSVLVNDAGSMAPSVAAGLQTRLEFAVGSPDESKIDWFREDPLLNEHHAHWHIVYARSIVKDRQGEMFLYMHRQMLARYDAERLAEGIPRLAAFDNMENFIVVGYAPGDDGRLSGPRAPNTKVDPASAAQQLSDLANIKNDLAGGIYDPLHPTDPAAEINAMDLFGGTLESNRAGEPKTYGNYHGNGHGYIGSLNDGVMLDTQTAVRDVIFWEWHKGIDDLYEDLITRLQPHSIFTDAPPVAFRKSVDNNDHPYTPDLILCLMNELEPLGAMTEQAIGEQAFGGDNWNKDFAKGAATVKNAAGVEKSFHITDTLETSMARATISYTTDRGEEKRYFYDYLTHAPFCYFIRVENKSLQLKQVTVRIFLVPEMYAEESRMWIEMDKFLYDLPPASKHVIFRKDEQSSVIRKPAVKDPATHNTLFNPVEIEIDTQRCNCGWPYHLLLPKGKQEDAGMAFRLMVMITDAAIDLVGAEPDCGSLSFCGTRDNRYPDQRPLGYPFNRHFTGNGQAITNAITQNPHMAARTIFIRHKPS